MTEKQGIQKRGGMSAPTDGQPSTKPPREIMLSDLPADCTKLLNAETRFVKRDAEPTAAAAAPVPARNP